MNLMEVAEAGFRRWAEKPHNRKWAKKLDGTPIQNDLVVNMAEAFRSALSQSQPAPQPDAKASGVEEGHCHCQNCGKPFDTDMLVPDDVWERIKPKDKPQGGGLLCPTCIMDRAAAICGWTVGFVYPDRRGYEITAGKAATDAGVEEPTLPKPDWYSDGFATHSQPFDHNGLVAVPLFTEETVRKALATERERSARLREEIADLKHDIERAQNALSLEATARIEAEETGARLSRALNCIASLHMATTLGTHSRARYDLNRARSIARAALRELKGGE